MSAQLQVRLADPVHAMSVVGPTTVYAELVWLPVLGPSTFLCGATWSAGSSRRARRYASTSTSLRRASGSVPQGATSPPSSEASDVPSDSASPPLTWHRCCTSVRSCRR